MPIRVLAFGIAKDIFKSSSIELDTATVVSVRDLKSLLEERYSDLRQLPCYRIAINNEFAVDTDTVNNIDEVAIIPPVSGG